MNRTATPLALAALLVTGTLGARADETPKAASAPSAPNAAVVYWQAFAAMPSLDEQQKTLLNPAISSVTAPLHIQLPPIVALYDRALHELHRARAIAPCDWQLDTASGPELLLPHLEKARSLSRVALLRARLRFASGDTDAGVSDALAVLKLARDCGASPVVISILVGAAVEQAATDVLTAHMNTLNKAQLTQLAEALRELPATRDMALAIREEGRSFCNWLERKIDGEAARLSDPQAGESLVKAIGLSLGVEVGKASGGQDAEAQRKAQMLKPLTVADVRESLKLLRADYDALGQAASLPFAERAGRLKAHADSLASARQMKTREDALRFLSVLILPALSKACAREEEMLVRRELLRLAIASSLGDASPVWDVRGWKVEHRKTAQGFELHCLLDDKPVALIVAGKP